MSRTTLGPPLSTKSNIHLPLILCRPFFFRHWNGINDTSDSDFLEFIMAKIDAAKSNISISKPRKIVVHWGGPERWKLYLKLWLTHKRQG